MARRSTSCKGRTPPCVVNKERARRPGGAGIDSGIQTACCRSGRHRQQRVLTVVGNTGWQIGEMQHGTGIEGHHAVDAVFQLTDVAGPVVGHDRLGGFGVQSVRAADGREEVLQQERDIFPSFAQWREGETDDVEAVKQIFAETPAGNFAGEIAVRGGDDADIDLDALQRTDRPELAFLQDAQEFDLKVERQVAHFIEESSAAAGMFDKPAFGLTGSGESAPGVSEEFAFHERADERAAVNRDKVTAGCSVEQFTGGDLLAGAAFALEEDGGAAGPEPLQLAADLGDTLRMPEKCHYLDVVPFRERILN